MLLQRVVRKASHDYELSAGDQTSEKLLQAPEQPCPRFPSLWVCVESVEVGGGGTLGYNPAFSNQIPKSSCVTEPLRLSRVRAEAPPTTVQSERSAREEDSKTQIPVYSSRKVLLGDAWECQQGEGSAPEQALPE